MQKTIDGIDPHKVPKHIAIIMDGNGRWAKARRLSRIDGHRAGAESIKVITEAAGNIGVKYLTLYAFSVENWKRPKAEVNALMSLLRVFLRKELNELIKNKIRLVSIGRTGELPPASRAELRRSEEITKDNDKLFVTLALNYGGRTEIVDAAREIARKCVAGELKPDDIDESVFARHLYGAKYNIPDPELMIRTSGEMRISNFLLWELSYAELYVTKTLWPDFRELDLYEAIREYQNRERRFGGI
jgi:undecaprenyl diphosphate synthase